jgi:hypothetical protein
VTTSAEVHCRIRQLTLVEIIRVCSCALIPQPVMMILSGVSMNAFKKLRSTDMTAGTNDRLPFRLRKIPSIPPAHHSTPCF